MTAASRRQPLEKEKGSPLPAWKSLDPIILIGF